MMKRIYYLVMAFVLLVASCSKDVGHRELEQGFGNVEFSAKMDMSVTESTRSGVTMELPRTQLPDEVIPANGSLFSLDISGTYVDFDTNEERTYEKFYSTLADYDYAKVQVGSYVASLALGDITAEGINLAAFAGSASYSILAGKTIDVTVPVKLVNSAIVVVCTEYFNHYFTDATFTIRTESNNEFNYTNTTSGSWFFVAPGTEIFLKGTATKQNGVIVEIPESSVVITKAQTKHTISMDAERAGGISVVIDIDESLIAIDPIVIDLNPNL